MTKSGLVLAGLLFAAGCAETGAPDRQVHTSFSEADGLWVTDSEGRAQQLIDESLDVRVVVSPDGRWIAVEDMQLSNLVVVRLFRYSGDGYREVALPQIREAWEKLARAAGVAYEDLERARLGIEAFAASGDALRLHFQAETGSPSRPYIDSVEEIELNMENDGAADAD